MVTESPVASSPANSLGASVDSVDDDDDVDFFGLRRDCSEPFFWPGGDFIVDPDGTLLYGFWGDGPDDRPHVDDLLRALEHSEGSDP